MSQASAQGSHIWYELMTPDPDGAKAFYEAVVPGWAIGERLPGDQDYRMIGRSDGGFAGGVLGLTDDMRQHGAKPVWLGYIGVDDVDATVAQIEAKGGKALMPAFDIPQWPDRHGRRPAGQSLLRDEAGPARGEREEGKRRLLGRPGAARRLERAEHARPGRGTRILRRRCSAGSATSSWIWANMANIASSTTAARGSARCRRIVPGAPQGWRYYIRVPSIPKAVEAVKAGGGTIAMGPMEVPGGDHIIIGHDPQGAEFALVGKA